MPRAQALSYVIPARNAGVTLSATLDSLRAQRGSEWSALVVDDHSTDDTGAIARRASRMDPRIRVVGSPARGVARARDAGFVAAEAGEGAVCFLDADDVVAPDHGARLLAALEEPGATGAICAYRLVGDAPIEGARRFRSGDLSRASLLTEGKPIIGCVALRAVVLRRLAERFGALFDPCLACEDWDFWLRLDAAGVRWAPPVAGPLVDYLVQRPTRSASIGARYRDVPRAIPKWEPDPIEASRIARLWAVRFLARSLVREERELASEIRAELGSLSAPELRTFEGALNWSVLVEPPQSRASPSRLARALRGLVADADDLARRVLLGARPWGDVALGAAGVLGPGERLVIAGIGVNGRAALEGLLRAGLEATWLDDDPGARAPGRRIGVDDLDHRDRVLVTPIERAALVARLERSRAGGVLLPEHVPTAGNPSAQAAPSAA